MAASSASAPAQASSRPPAKPMPVRTACSSGMVSSSRSEFRPSFRLRPAARPMKATRSSDFSSSATLSAPYRRLSPAIGLSRFRSGVSALLENCSPPISTGPRKPASRHSPIIGSITHSSCSSRLPTWPNNWSGCLNSWGSGLSAIFIQPSEPRASGMAMVSSATTPAPNTAAVASSRERGMLPCSRASRRRFSLGCSVRSPLSSCSAMALRRENRRPRCKSRSSQATGNGRRSGHRGALTKTRVGAASGRELFPPSARP